MFCLGPAAEAMTTVAPRVHEADGKEFDWKLSRGEK